jgi:hypothetical protein
MKDQVAIRIAIHAIVAEGTVFLTVPHTAASSTYHLLTPLIVWMAIHALNFSLSCHFSRIPLGGQVLLIIGESQLDVAGKWRRTFDKARDG